MEVYVSIYFVQHGEALSKDIDPERGLSEKGRKESEVVARHLEKAGVSLKKIFHSGKTRAEQTAKIFAGELGNCEISEMSGMAPNDNVVTFSNLIEDETMYVGHMPHIQKLISHLLTGDENSNVISVSNSGVICLERKKNHYQILWHLPLFMSLSTSLTYS